MTGQAGHGAIVVGVDGSTSARQALNWAVAEAVVAHQPLHIVHSFTGPLMDYPFVSSSSEPPDGGFEAAAERLLADARKRATSAGSGIVKVTSELVRGAPSSALLARAHDAELLVVGGRGPDGSPASERGRWGAPWRPMLRAHWSSSRRPRAAIFGRQSEELLPVWIVRIFRQRRSGLLSRVRRAARQR